MTAAELNRLSANTVPEHARSWMASVSLHGLGIAVSLLVVGAMEPPISPSLFQWEISMVDSPTRTELQPAEPVVQPFPPTVKPSHPVRLTKSASAEQPLPLVHQEATVPVETIHMVTDMVTNAESVMEYAAVASTENQPVTLPSVVEAQAESSEPSVIEETVPVGSIAPSTELRVVEYRQVLHRETRADYGWLRDALWGRIEELKRYPALARTNHWEGKVVVSAVIRDDGEVMGVQIAETSGRAVLDEEAMAVMKKASPLRLKHPLGQRQITILIPISYRLDG